MLFRKVRHYLVGWITAVCRCHILVFFVTNWVEFCIWVSWDNITLNQKLLLFYDLTILNPEVGPCSFHLILSVWKVLQCALKRSVPLLFQQFTIYSLRIIWFIQWKLSLAKPRIKKYKTDILISGLLMNSGPTPCCCCTICVRKQCQSKWPGGLRRGSAATSLLEFQVRIPPGAWMSLLWVFVLSGRGLCDRPITRPEESYRVWCVLKW